MIFTPFSASLNDNGKLDFSTIFGSFGNKASQVEKQINSDVEALTKFKSAIDAGQAPIIAFQENLSKSSKSAKEFASELASGNHTVDEYATRQAAASKSIATVGTSSKLASVGVKALNIAMNVGTWLVITEAINLAYKAIDNWVNRIKNQEQALSDATQAYTDAKQKVTDTNTQLDDTNKKISELQSKGTLTFVEQSQLNTLIQTRSELEKQLETYKLLEEEKNKGQTDTAVKTLQSYGGRKRNLNTGEEDPAWLSLFTTDNEKESNQIDNFIQKYQQLSSLGNKATSDQQTQLTSLKKNLVDIANEYGSTANKISDNSDNVSLKTKTDALAIRNSILKVVDAANYETTAFNNVYKNANFTNVVSQLNSLAQQGKLTVNTFNQSSYKNIAKAFSDAGISAKDAATQINALNKSTSNNNSAAKQAATSNSDLAKSLKDLMSSNVKNYQALETILGDVKNYKTLSSDNLNSLLKMFPDMSSAVLEYNAGLKSTASMVDLIKSKMKSLQSSYQQELQQELANNADFYNSTIGQHTDLTNQLSNLYGIDYRNYSTYAQLKSAVDTAVDNTTIGNSKDTAKSLGQTYYANVQNYSQYEIAKTNVANQILNDIQNLNTAQLSKLAAVYGVDVSNFANTQQGKIAVASQIANKIAQIYGALNTGFASTLKDQRMTIDNQIEKLEEEYSRSRNSANKSEISKQISQLQSEEENLASATTSFSSTSTDSLISKINGITNSVKVSIPETTSALKAADTAANKAAKSAANSGESAAKKAEEAAKNAAEALKNQYEYELKSIEAYKELDKYTPDKYGVEGFGYYKDLLSLYNKWKNTTLDYDDKVSLQEKVLSAHKDYEQSMLDVSNKELENRIALGKVQENSMDHLRNLYQIQNLLNSAGMKEVATDENKLELQKKIYDVQKAYAESTIALSYKEMQNRLDFGKVRENSKEELQNLKEIQSWILHGKTAQPDNTEETRLEVEKKIYDVQKGMIQNDLDDLDTQVQLGKVQENSLAYISKLYDIKQKINKSDLNTIDKANDLNSIEEKILDARKSYIQGLESDLSDESIVNSYGYRIKQIQDQIDAINNQADAQSKELAVEKAKAAWEEAQNNKTVQIYTNKSGFVYEANQLTVTEKKQALSDAEREKQIEDLTKQKDQIQKDEDSVKKQLENALKTLEGTNNQSWSNILNQIEGVLGQSVQDISDATNKNEQSWDKQNQALDESTQNQKDNYKKQETALQNHLDKVQPMLNKLTSFYTNFANSVQKAADAMNNLAFGYSNAEENRENANYRYYEYNKELAKNGNAVKYYASGTDYSQQGWANTDENGYELKLQPISSGQYTWLNEGSKVLTADMTKNLEAWSKYNPQTMVLKAMSGNNHVGSNVTNNKITDTGTTIHQTFSNAKFEIQSDSGQQLMDELSNIGIDAIQRVNKH